MAILILKKFCFIKIIPNLLFFEQEVLYLIELKIIQ